MEGLLGGRLQLDSRPELEPFALRWQDRLLNASRGEQAADWRISEHADLKGLALIPGVRISLFWKWVSLFSTFTPTIGTPHLCIARVLFNRPLCSSSSRPRRDLDSRRVCWEMQSDIHGARHESPMRTRHLMPASGYRCARPWKSS